MLEKILERKLVKAVRNAGGFALKFVSPGMAGVPDRLLLFPGGRMAFAEVKAPGEKPRPLQVHRMEQLSRLGFKAFVVDNEQAITSVLSEVAEGVQGGSKRPEIEPVCSISVENGWQPRALGKPPGGKELL